MMLKTLQASCNEFAFARKLWRSRRQHVFFVSEILHRILTQRLLKCYPEHVWLSQLLFIQRQEEAGATAGSGLECTREDFR